MKHLCILLSALALLAAGCGGGGDADTTDPPTTTAAASATSAPSSTAGPPASTTTEAQPPTTTTQPEPTGPEPLATEDIPDLVFAWGEGTGDPLELAQQVIGFPLAIPTPDNTTPLHISVDMFGGDSESPWEWDWSYEVLSSEPMPDIDIHAEEPSPGSVALREFYDPIMADLGWTYSNSTGSDPGDVGGPNSINHVYQSDADTLTVNGFPATPKPVFVWADEEQVFGEGVPGYQVDVPFEFEPGVIPVPLVQTIVDEFPEVDGSTFADFGLLSWNRPDDSFDAEWGLRYFEVSIEWVLPPGVADETKTAIADHDSTAIVAGAASFFDPGFFEPEEPREFGDEWTQSVVFLDRYPGTVTISGDDATGATLELELDFEPNRPVLQELTD